MSASITPAVSSIRPITAQDPQSQSLDLQADNIAKLKALFPELLTEVVRDGKNGKTTEASINIDVLKALVGDATATDADEKYGLNWHGKRKARQLALTPSTGTLRPSKADSVDWDNTQNLMIEGDNLEVLKLLQKSYAGKVKLIYIDPPYNTGKDFVYPDNFQDNIKNYLELTGQVEGGQRLTSNPEASGRFHTDWLNMMYPRLKLARNLLRDDGVLIISIDDAEAMRLKAIADDIFGEENFISQLVWKKKYTGGQHAKFYADFHEYILVYAKSIQSIEDFGVNRTEEEAVKFSESDEYEVTRGKFYTRPLKSNLEERKTLIYPLKMPDGSVLKTQWLVGQERFEREFNEKRIIFKQKNDGLWNVYKKYYQLDGNGKTKPPTLIERFPNTEAKNELKNLFSIKEGRDNIFYTVKPVNLINYLAEPFLDKYDVCLDFFGGSGTTGHAVMAQNAADNGNRKYILVQLPEPLDPENKDQKTAADFCTQLGKPLTIAELTKERLRRAGAKVKADNPLFAGDVGFRVFKLDTSNIRAWQPTGDIAADLLSNQNHLIDGRTSDDVLYELLLKLGLDLCVPIELQTIAGKACHSIGGGVLMACLAESITVQDAEPLALGMAAWLKTLAPAGDVTAVFRDSAFENDVAKSNLAAILAQHGVAQVRSL